LEFNSTATANVINDVYELVPTINDYYEKELYMGPFDNPTKRPLHDFMREYVAQATIENDKGVKDATAYSLAIKAFSDKGNAVHKIAHFFIFGSGLKVEKEILGVDINIDMQNNIADTHKMPTYGTALQYNGFGTVYIYRNN
jgi:hypothetical protein